MRKSDKTIQDQEAIIAEYLLGETTYRKLGAMGTKVLKLENKKHGSYQFETTDPMGNRHGFNGTIHEFVPNQKITRTFEMENTPFAVQLEFLEFEQLNEDTSKLTMHIIYKSVALRDQMLKLPFAQGINMAHNRIQDIFNKLK